MSDEPKGIAMGYIEELNEDLVKAREDIKALREALQLSKKHLRYGVPARDMKIIGDALREDVPSE